ncbi:alpha/beta hydrolase [Pseudarthrobacter sp. ATCC 49987]|uniref:alpha/beta hydrolase n=1 Tax=Pseudarthrobacter sp. ATCC 49987 TaxID=2698204 RepID=UPI001F2B3BA6|nr:alpha/beta hydrolase [Pseudarthrobacter sp. ATCC 49987]
MKATMPEDPGSPRAAALGSAVLEWSGALAAGTLVVVPLWMLLGNSAVLGGHPALPVLLLAAVALGLLWMFLLAKDSGLNKARSVTNRGQENPEVSRWQLARGILVRLAALVLVAGLAWLNPFAYDPSGEAGQTTGTTAEDATSITLAPEGKASAGLVFYPGARVDARAYQDILGPIANAGHLVVILKVPLGIPLLDIGQARGAMDAHPEITSWAVGGHSLGGVSAASFAKSNSDVSGLLLFASYPADSMSDSSGLSVLSISGSNDGLTTPDKIAASKSLLPPTARYATVEGGVHAFFGDYGEQPGDGEPGITREWAQKQITAESVRFMDRLRAAS